jgi:branched-chain amino acid transport system substrate-binding protein
MARTEKLKLGWLFPYSGIFKNLRSDLRQGLDLALEKEGITTLIESHPEFIQTGSFKDTEDALKKLLLFEEVDLVIGVTSSKVALGLRPLLESRQTPVIILNLGADIPIRDLSSDFLFYNSLHLWKSEWAMGKWAQRKYGGEPSINMSVYEGGYGLHEAFRLGTSVSGAETVKLNIVKNFGAASDTTPLIDYIREQQPNYAHILLSGKEGDQFLQLFREHGLDSITSLTVNPFMVEDGSMAITPPCDCYSASTWSLNLDRHENNSFRELYNTAYGSHPNAFSLLAFEAGLALAAAIQSAPGTSGTPGGRGRLGKEELARTLALVKPHGPRGEIALSTRPLQTDLPVYIRTTVKDSSTGRLENSILETETGVEWTDQSLAAGISYLSGWQNPYLCV